MAIKHAKFLLLCCHCWWLRFFLLMYSQFCCEIKLLWWNKFIKFIEIKWNLIKFLMEKCVIPSFHIIKLLCCGNNFSKITFIQKSLSHWLFLRTLLGHDVLSRSWRPDFKERTIYIRNLIWGNFTTPLSVDTLTCNIRNNF